MIENKYKRWYDALMERARGRILVLDCEGHHILPLSLGGSNDPSNIVKLTYREHFLAHWLITKFYTGDQKRRMMHALHMMSRRNSFHSRVTTGWQFAAAKRAIGEARRGWKHTAEAKQKMSAALQGHRLTPEQNQRMINTKMGHVVSEATRLKMSIVMTGRKASEETRIKNRNAQLGKKHTPERKLNISRSMKAAMQLKAAVRRAASDQIPLEI